MTADGQKNSSMRAAKIWEGPAETVKSKNVLIEKGEFMRAQSQKGAISSPGAALSLALPATVTWFL